MEFWEDVSFEAEDSAGTHGWQILGTRAVKGVNASLPLKKTGCGITTNGYNEDLIQPQWFHGEYKLGSD